MTMWGMASMAVPMWGVAGMISAMTARVALGLVASLLLHVLAASLLLKQCSVMIIAYACIALLTFGLWCLDGSTNTSCSNV